MYLYILQFCHAIQRQTGSLTITIGSYVTNQLHQTIKPIKNDSMRLFSTESMKPIRASEISKGVGASPRPKPKSVLNASFFLNQRFLIFLLKINKLVFAPFFLSIEKPEFEFNCQRLVYLWWEVFTLMKIMMVPSF